MLILGIDPGLRCTGFGCIETDSSYIRIAEAGVIKTSDKGELAQRLLELHRGLTEVIKAARPDIVAVESLYSHYKHPRTAILMGHARGTILVSASCEGTPVIDYPATKIKKSLTGNGRASKMQMQKAIASALGLKEVPEPADVADALAAALCHANALRHDHILAGAKAAKKTKQPTRPGETID